MRVIAMRGSKGEQEACRQHCIAPRDVADAGAANLAGEAAIAAVAVAVPAFAVVVEVAVEVGEDAVGVGRLG